MNQNSYPTAQDVESIRQYNIDRIRAQFPALQQTVYNKPLVYLDNAATAQKPQVVIDTLSRYYALDNSNVHRGVHALSMRSTKAFEDTRAKVAKLLHAAEPREIVFVRGTTEAINLVAHSYGRPNVTEGDEIIVSEMEHHSNIVPWQILCEEKKARLRVIPMDDDGELLLDEYRKLLSPRTKFVSLVYVSNSLGTINPIKEMTDLAHEHGVPVLVDGAQVTPQMAVDVQDLGCDFFAFSSHKMYGPTGVGALYGRQDLLEKMPPYQGGGDMIRSVTFEKTLYNHIPFKFEAGTPNVADVIGMGAAIDYLLDLGYDGISAHAQDLLAYATERLSKVKGVRLIGTARRKAGVVSFVMEGIHPHDVGTILDHEGIAIRTGHHCTQPVMQHFGVPATSRASFGIYNTRGEIDALIRALGKVEEVFR
jgi:cysteine desulfurase/selenocysteine lyase